MGCNIRGIEIVRKGVLRMWLGERESKTKRLGTGRQ